MDRFSCSLIALLLLIANPVWAREAAPSRQPDLAEFMKFCADHREAFKASIPLADIPQLGKVTFVPTGSLEGNQGRFAWASVERKMTSALASEPNTYIDKKKGEWVFPDDKGH